MTIVLADPPEKGWVEQEVPIQKGLDPAAPVRPCEDTVENEVTVDFSMRHYVEHAV